MAGPFFKHFQARQRGRRADGWQKKIRNEHCRGATILLPSTLLQIDVEPKRASIGIGELSFGLAFDDPRYFIREPPNSF